MKKSFLFISGVSFLFILYSCTSDRKRDLEADSSAFDTQEETEIGKPSIISDIPWTALLDSSTQKYTLQKSELINSKELDSTNVIESINRKYPENKLTWDYQRNDTAFVSIAD